MSNNKQSTISESKKHSSYSMLRRMENTVATAVLLGSLALASVGCGSGGNNNFNTGSGGGGGTGGGGGGTQPVSHNKAYVLSGNVVTVFEDGQLTGTTISPQRSATTIISNASNVLLGETNGSTADFAVINPVTDLVSSRVPLDVVPTLMTSSPDCLTVYVSGMTPCDCEPKIDIFNSTNGTTYSPTYTLQSSQGLPNPITSIVVSPDNNYIALTSGANAPGFYLGTASTNGPDPFNAVVGIAGVYGVGFSLDSTQAYAGLADALGVIAIPSQTILGTIPINSQTPFGQPVVAPNGTVYVGNSTALVAINPQSGAIVQQFAGDTLTQWPALFPDGKSVLSLDITTDSSGAPEVVLNIIDANTASMVNTIKVANLNSANDATGFNQIVFSETWNHAYIAGGEVGQGTTVYIIDTEGDRSGWYTQITVPGLPGYVQGMTTEEIDEAQQGSQQSKSGIKHRAMLRSRSF